MLAFIKSEIKPDIVVWNGDTYPHDIAGNKNISDIVQTVNYASNMIAEYF